MITHFGFRFAPGLHVLLLGIVLLLIYGNRHRSNLWGRLSRLGDAFHQGRVPDRPQARLSGNRMAGRSAEPLGGGAPSRDRSEELRC